MNVDLEKRIADLAFDLVRAEGTKALALLALYGDGQYQMTAVSGPATTDLDAWRELQGAIAGELTLLWSAIATRSGPQNLPELKNWLPITSSLSDTAASAAQTLGVRGMLLVRVDDSSHHTFGLSADSDLGCAQLLSQLMRLHDAIEQGALRASVE